MNVNLEAMMADLPASQRIAVWREEEPASAADPATLLAAALESPFEFPALRKALTPDDHVAIAVDEELPDLPTLLTPLLDHLSAAQIAPEAITLLTTAPAPHDWMQRLPARFAQVRLEQHDSVTREKLSYLATTKQGRRVYLNRTAVDADQLIVLSRRFYDPVLGRGGAEGMIYPCLGDAPTHKAVLAELSMATAAEKEWAVRKEAAEISWLLGAPFFIQVIPGSGDGINQVLAGPLAASQEGDRLLDQRWHAEVEEPADVVVATVSASPAIHGLGPTARALASASRVTRRDGRIIVINESSMRLDDASQILRQNDLPADVMSTIRNEYPPGSTAAFQWAHAASAATIYLWSPLADEMVEELFAVPMSNAAEVSRVIGTGKFIWLRDADRIEATLRSPKKLSVLAE